MFETIETWCREHQYIIAALSASSTFAAVVVSLVIAIVSARSSSTRLSANMNVMQIFGGMYSSKNGPEFCAVHVTNKGITPLTIPYSCLYFRTPFNQRLALLPPVDAVNGRSVTDVATKSYPVEIGPRRSETFYFLSPMALEEEMTQLFSSMTWLQQRCFRFTRLRLCTSDNKVITVGQAGTIKDIFKRVIVNGSHKLKQKK